MRSTVRLQHVRLICLSHIDTRTRTLLLQYHAHLSNIGECKNVNFVQEKVSSDMLDDLIYVYGADQELTAIIPSTITSEQT